MLLVLLCLDLLFIELADVLVDPFGELQVLVDIARAGFIWSGADGEILLRLPL
jgi:hypothetical protein